MLWIKVLDDDTGVDGRLGKAKVDLGELAPSRDPKPLELTVDKGDAVMFLSISYATVQKGEFTVLLERVENLRDADLIGKSDPYVKFYLEQDNRVFDKGFGKKESTKKKDQLSPVYNETFTWEDIFSLKKMVLWITVKDDDVGVDKTIAKGKLDLENYTSCVEPKAVSINLEGGKKTVMYLKISHQ